MATQLTRFKNRRRTASAWLASNEVLLEGEIGFVIGTSPLLSKTGDGVSTWVNLKYTVPADTWQNNFTEYSKNYTNNMVLPY